jgi:hypothetical protein
VGLRGSIDTILAIYSTREQKLFETVPVEPRSTPMIEFEFDRLLEMVAEAVGPDPQESEMRAAWFLKNAPHAANDNQMAWPMVPFPAGWCASC